MSEWISVKDRLPDSITPRLITYINRNPAPYYEHIKDKPFTGAGYYFNNIANELVKTTTYHAQWHGIYTDDNRHNESGNTL